MNNAIWCVSLSPSFFIYLHVRRSIRSCCLSNVITLFDLCLQFQTSGTILFREMHSFVEHVAEMSEHE